MNDKYVKLADVKRKLRYIFKAYGVGSFVREKIERTLNDLPYSVKSDLETTLEAADVQPVKHGRWFHINNDGIIYCSECNNEAYWDTDYGQQLFDFCPYCGARMIKEGDTND